MTRLVVVRGNSGADAELVSLGEAALIAGLSKPRLHELYSRRRPKVQPFPAPIARTAQGPVWHKPDIEAWCEGRDERRRAEEAERERRRRELEERFALEPPSYETLLARADAVGEDRDAEGEDWKAVLERIARGSAPAS